MKKNLLILALASVFALAAGQVFADMNDQCLMCHQDLKENPVEAHRDCMACHSGGAEEHIDNIRQPPDPVTDETCTSCHEKTDEFLEIRAHQMDMECSACHTIHEK